MSLMMHKTVGDKVFDAANYLMMLIFMFTILAPFIFLFYQSLTPTGYDVALNRFLLPQRVTLDNYRSIIDNEYMWTGYYNTIYRTVLGTAVSLLATSVGAYCLSKKYFPNRVFWTFFILFTMFFSGGLIPRYLWIRSLGLLDNRWVLILPGLVGTYNLIIMRNFFQQLPVEIEESGRMDGANNLIIFFRLILPISKPILATVGLWLMVGHWNAWFDQLIYISDVKKFVLQVVLRRIVLEGTKQMIEASGASGEEFRINPEGIKAACIYAATLPIICVYPFLQKYFVKGVIMGSLKG